MISVGDRHTAMVVFVDRTECRWLRWLKPGFRHCFIALRSDRRWLICDPLKDRMELGIVELPSDFDLPRFYAEQGHHVLVGATNPALPRRTLALAPLTCVAVVKRVLCIHAPLVLTPWQLFRYLRRRTMLQRWHPITQDHQPRPKDEP